MPQDTWLTDVDPANNLANLDDVATFRNIKFDLLFRTVYPLGHHDITRNRDNLQHATLCTRNSQ